MDQQRARISGSPDLLFTYGTLGPLGSDVEGWVADRVRGRLFDLGPYPVLVDWNDPKAGWVEGHVRAVSVRELEDRLDAYEGVSEGLFLRSRLFTEGGRLVWVYVYPHAVPPEARGPLARWERQRAVDPGPPAV